MKNVMEKFRFVLFVVFVNHMTPGESLGPYTGDLQYIHYILRAIVDLESNDTQVKSTVAALTTQLTEALHTIKELNSTVQVLKSRDSSSGSTYIRWGNNTCPDGDSTQVYTGYGAGSYYSHTGGGSSPLCLPKDPQWATYNGIAQSISFIYGMEYEYGGKLQDLEVPCSVCRIPRSSTLMLPARYECYPGWKLEYNGYLASSHYTHQRSEYICVDDDTEAVENSKPENDNGALLYSVEARCGSLPCGPYINGRELTCAVCSYSPHTSQTAFQPYT